MRKQTARIALCCAVLPITALLLYGIPSHSPAPQSAGDGHGGARASVRPPGGTGAAGPVSGHFAMVNAVSVRHRHIAATDAGTPLGDATATTSIANLAATLVHADSQVLTQVQALRDRSGPSAAHTTPTTAPPAQPAAPPATQSQPAPPPTDAPPPPDPTASYPAPSPSESAILACIRNLESGDDYANTSNPDYRGAYQFSYSTWAAMGGTGDPAAASPAEQDMRAEMLVAAAGWSPWNPTAYECGAPQ